MNTNLNNYKQLQTNIGYFFKDISLLQNALTHRSYYFHSNEKTTLHNEKLEFLGDRVLGLVISSYIYKNYPKAKVGEMARYFSFVVSSNNLLNIAYKINLIKYIKTNKSTKDNNALDKILIDAVEAIISAVFLDSSFQEAEKVILNLFKNSFTNIVNRILNPKGFLQEFAQQNNKPLPIYKVIDQKGPDHKPTFKVQLILEGYDTIEIESLNIKNAQKELAEMFIKKYIKKLKHDN